MPLPSPSPEKKEFSDSGPVAFAIAGEGNNPSSEHHCCYWERGRKPTPTSWKELVPELFVSIITGNHWGENRRKIIAGKLLLGNHCMPFNFVFPNTTYFFHC